MSLGFSFLLFFLLWLRPSSKEAQGCWGSGHSDPPNQPWLSQRPHAAASHRFLLFEAPEVHRIFPALKSPHSNLSISYRWSPGRKTLTLILVLTGCQLSLEVIKQNPRTGPTALFDKQGVSPKPKAVLLVRSTFYLLFLSAWSWLHKTASFM